MYKYRNTSEQALVIPNVGIVDGKGEIESAVFIENPNLELMGNNDAPQAVQGVASPQPSVPVEAPQQEDTK